MSNPYFKNLEAYLFSENREQFINTLISGTDEYYFFKFLHLLNSKSELTADEEQQIKSFYKETSKYRSAYNIEVRYLLKKFDSPKTTDKEKEEILERLKSYYISPSYGHSKPITVGSSALSKGETTNPSVFEESSVPLEQIIKQATSDWNSMRDLKPAMYHKIDTKELIKAKNRDLIEHFLKNADPLEIGDYLELVHEYAKRQQGNSKNPLRVPEYQLRKLTLDQLLKLGTMIPDLSTDQTYTNEVFYRKFNISMGSQIGKGLPKDERRQLLLDVYTWAKELPHVTQSVGIEALDEILQLGIELNKYSVDLFKEYLKKPARVYNNLNKNHSKQLDYSRSMMKWNFFNKGEWINHDELIRSYLTHIFATAKSIQPYDEYLEESYLKEIFYSTKLLMGETIPDINNYLSADKLKQLSESKEMTIVKHNKEYFGLTDPVTITMQIKNVPNILVKVFEFQPENYYLKENRELDPVINLDGLIATEEWCFENKEPPFKKFPKDFTFEQISKKGRGIYIIDFIGNGLSTRAIIKKGKLSIIDKDTVAGQVFYIIDEEKNICKGERTGLWASGKFYKTDDQGRILIPYSSSQNIQAVLVHEDFSERAEISLKAESFNFKCSFLYNNEAMLQGNKAKVLVQPRLFIHQQPIGLDIIKEASAVVTTYTDTGVPTHTPFDKIKFNHKEELELEFPIPGKCMRVEIKVKASIPKINKKDENYDFETTQSIPIDLHLNSYEFCQLYLRYSNEGYDVHVLGKNGEPKPRMDLSITYTHRYLNDVRTVNLTTDQKGRVRLGKLKDITQIVANLKEVSEIRQINRTWFINNDKRFNYPSRIHLVKKEKFNLPLSHNELNKNKVQFVSTLPSGEPLKDLLSTLKIADKALTVGNLEVGHYKLHLKDVGHTITIQVLEGDKWKANDNFISTKNALYNVKNQVNNIIIEKVDIVDNKGQKDIVIDAFADDPETARFHVYACQFLVPNMHKSVLSLDGNLPGLPFEIIPTETRKAIFMNNRKLGDEYVYVLDRKNKTRYIGNTLERPQILLKRTFVRDTDNKAEELSSTQDFNLAERDRRELAEEGKRMAKMKHDLKPSASSAGTSDTSIDSYLNFLANPSVVYSNLKLDKDWKITIPNFPVENYAFIQIVASNLVANISEIHPLPSPEIPTKDVSLKSQLKKDSFYSINRGSHNVSKGGKVIVKDITSNDFQVVDSVPKLFDIQKALILCNGSDTANGGYTFWSFIRDWGTLTEEEKLKKYDKFACHELNVFIYFKDPAFFKTCVRPFLKNKIEKTIVDYALLEDDGRVLDLASAENSERWNALELALAVNTLFAKHPKQAKAISAQIENKAKLIKVQTNTFKRLFDTVLNSKTEDDKAAIKIATTSSNKLNALPRMAQNIQQNAPVLLSAPMMSNINYERERAPRMKKQAYGIQKEEEECDEACEMEERLYDKECSNAFDDDFDGSAGNEYMEMRSQIRSGFQELEKTKEYCERNYYGSTSNVSIAINSFWADLTKHLCEHGHTKPFLTQNFIYAANSQTEMLGVLSFIDLPFTAGNHTYSNFEGRGLSIEAASDAVVFLKEISEGKAELKPEILVSQRFFDPKQRYTESEEEPGVEIEKEIDQYVINKVYGCKVTVTNCSVASQEVQVLIEIPEGSIPVYQLDYTKSHTIKLPSTGNSSIETFFYFPTPGNFKVYPSNVSKNGKVMAQGVEQFFQVEKERVYKSLETVTAILSQGNEEDILNFVRTKNIWDSKVFNPGEIWWLLKNKDFFLKYVAILRDRNYYDNTTWSYGWYHKDIQTIREWFDNASNNGRFSSYFAYCSTSLLKYDTLRLLEYHPYVNPRVHLIASEKNQILNNQLRDQYRTYITYLCDIPNLKTEHYLGLVYYLLLQDRIEEAITAFKKINAEELKKSENFQLQYDYFAAYLDFYTGHPKFTVARDICMKYLNYPVLSWRSLFIDVANQLAEFDGDEMIADEMFDDTEKKQNAKNAEKEEIINMELEGTKLNITYQNIREITVLFYKVDLEILFSRNPFLSQTRDEFGFIKPSHSHRVIINNGGDLTKVDYQIPPDLVNSNVFIQLRTENRILSTTYFSTSLRVQIIENYGQVKVTDSEDKPLKQVYVKCFAKTKSGQVNFYKDGYTDLRGRFDYATLNSGDVSNIEKFAILINDDKLGSLTKEANAPVKLGRVETNLIIRSKAAKYEQYQEEAIQKEMVMKSKKAVYK